MRPIPRSKRIALFESHPKSLVRIYSRQHVDALAVAQEKGYFSGEHNHQDFDDMWQKQYNWMRDQMAKSIPNFSGELPMWAYLKRPWHKGWWKLRKDIVMITALVPRERMIFSDYESWHLPLNNGPICDSEIEYDEWYDNTPDADPSPTWHKCLDICGDDKMNNDWMRPSNMIQACVDRIYINEIITYKYAK